jgi:phosphatidylglycerol lysyltransferase
VVVGYHVLTIVVRTPLRVHRWQLRLPSLGLAVLQTLISLLDWSLAAFALYVLLPAEVSVGFFVLLGIFALANLGGLISHVPGGIGVFEGLMLLAIPSEGQSAGVAAALIAYRLIYYVLPLLVAALLLGAHQLLPATAVGQPKRQRPVTIAATAGK